MTPPLGGGRGAAGPLLGGRFALTERLDRGPFGEVWAAVDRRSGGPCVVKVGAADVAPWGPAREVAVASRGPRHPSLVRPLAVGETDAGRPWIATPRLAGAPLSLVLRAGPLGAGAVTALLTDLVGALEALHAVGVLHRDLKPGNVLLSSRPPPTAFLLDLGVAALSLAPAPGLRTGTPGYAAPEQLAGAACGPPVDVWGLGALGCAALGAWPPAGGGPPGALGALLMACVDPSPGARPGLGELRRALPGCAV